MVYTIGAGCVNGHVQREVLKRDQMKQVCGNSHAPKRSLIPSCSATDNLVSVRGLAEQLAFQALKAGNRRLHAAVRPLRREGAVNKSRVQTDFYWRPFTTKRSVSNRIAE